MFDRLRLLRVYCCHINMGEGQGCWNDNMARAKKKNEGLSPCPVSWLSCGCVVRDAVLFFTLSHCATLRDKIIIYIVFYPFLVYLHHLYTKGLRIPNFRASKDLPSWSGPKEISPRKELISPLSSERAIKASSGQFESFRRSNYVFTYIRLP